MAAFAIFVLWSYVVVQVNCIQLTLKADRPSLRVQVSQTANLQCCYNTTGGSPDYTWTRSLTTMNRTMNRTMSEEQVNRSDPRVTTGMDRAKDGVWCPTLTLRDVQFSDAGLYQCFLHHNALRPSVYSHGTYLQVYKPMQRILNTSESTKNKILTAQGILLLLCLILHGVPLLLKSKRLNERHEKKMKKEEENIYEGLNLEDCCKAYDQIQRAQVPNPYQDVGNVMEEEEEIQLEKP